MADDADLDDPASTELPEPVRQWLAEISNDQGVSQEELLRALLTQIQTAEPHQSDTSPVSPDSDARSTERFEELRTEFRALVEDVRERVIQVKRETDQKAPASHDHPSIKEELTRLDDTVSEMETTRLDLQSTVDHGFENFEEILEYVTDTTDSLSSKVTTLAAAVVELRDQTEEIIEFQSEQAVLVHLTNKANTNGVTKAKCDACGERVYLGLLRTPRCPNCSEVVRDLDVNRGLFGSSTLKTGSLPALRGETADDEGVDLSNLTTDSVPDEHPDRPL